MNNTAGIRLLIVLAALALTACASFPPVAPPSLDASCREQLQTLDRQLVRQGLQAAGARRIPGFPHLRVTRFWASFREQPMTPGQQRVWVEGLREEDRHARFLELQRLGKRGEDWAGLVEDCGQRLLQATLHDPQQMQRLRERAVVPSEYSSLARLFGLYPVAVPFLRMGIADYQAETLASFRRPLTLPTGAVLQRWAPSGDVPNTRADWRHDALGIPQLSSAQWQALFRRHAPVWEIETVSVDDRPGALRWLNGGFLVSSDTAVSYVRPAFTRFRGEVLPQLVYSLWFPRRTATGPLDPYAGEFDAVIWRVTLDRQGRPLVYDSIHGCGCYHLVFPLQGLTPMPAGDYWQEPVLFPQAQAPAGAVRLRLAAGNHYLKRVLPVDGPVGTASYSLLSAEQLLALDTAKGSRSLFDPDGLLPASARSERFWLWPSGVVSPGAMRQYGHHATAFVGQRHFDDPYLLDQWFDRD